MTDSSTKERKRGKRGSNVCALITDAGADSEQKNPLDRILQDAPHQDGAA